MSLPSLKKYIQHVEKIVLAENIQQQGRQDAMRGVLQSIAAGELSIDDVLQNPENSAQEDAGLYLYRQLEDIAGDPEENELGYALSLKGMGENEDHLIGILQSKLERQFGSDLNEQSMFGRADPSLGITKGAGSSSGGIGTSGGGGLKGGTAVTPRSSAETQQAFAQAAQAAKSGSTTAAPVKPAATTSVPTPSTTSATSAPTSSATPSSVRRSTRTGEPLPPVQRFNVPQYTLNPQYKMQPGDVIPKDVLGARGITPPISKLPGAGKIAATTAGTVAATTAGTMALQNKPGLTSQSQATTDSGKVTPQTSTPASASPGTAFSPAGRGVYKSPSTATTTSSSTTAPSVAAPTTTNAVVSKPPVSTTQSTLKPPQFSKGVQDIATANKIDNPNLIRVGQTLNIPGSDTPYTVKAGDTLSGIAAGKFAAPSSTSATPSVTTSGVPADTTDYGGSLEEQGAEENSVKHMKKENKSQAHLTESVLDEKLERIFNSHPHEHKACLEGWGMAESLYQALCDHYWHEGRIPKEIMHGDRQALRDFVEECYVKDTQKLFEEPLEEVDTTRIPAVRRRELGHPAPTLSDLGTTDKWRVGSKTFTNQETDFARRYAEVSGLPLEKIGESEMQAELDSNIQEMETDMSENKQKTIRTGSLSEQIAKIRAKMDALNEDQGVAEDKVKSDDLKEWGAGLSGNNERMFKQKPNPPHPQIAKTEKMLQTLDPNAYSEISVYFSEDTPNDLIQKYLQPALGNALKINVVTFRDFDPKYVAVTDPKLFEPLLKAYIQYMKEANVHPMSMWIGVETKPAKGVAEGMWDKVKGAIGLGTKNVMEPGYIPGHKGRGPYDNPHGLPYFDKQKFLTDIGMSEEEFNSLYPEDQKFIRTNPAFIKMYKSGNIKAFQQAIRQYVDKEKKRYMPHDASAAMTAYDRSRGYSEGVAEEHGASNVPRQEIEKMAKTLLYNTDVPRDSMKNHKQVGDEAMARLFRAYPELKQDSELLKAVLNYYYSYQSNSGHYYDFSGAVKTHITKQFFSYAKATPAVENMWNQGKYQIVGGYGPESKMWADLKTIKNYWHKRIKPNELTGLDPTAQQGVAEGQVNEKLTKSMSAGDVISDFVGSDDSKFKGKSKAERTKMALGAYYGMHPEKSRKKADESVEEDVERGHMHDIKQTATGRKVTRRVDPEGMSVGSADPEAKPRGRGRPSLKQVSGGPEFSPAAKSFFGIPGKPFKAKDLPGKASVKHRIKENDIQMESWDQQLHSLLNEGMTVTTSTGNEGASDSVSVSATDADAQTLMKMLQNSGLLHGKSTAMSSPAADDIAAGTVTVEPVSADEVMGTLEPQGDDHGEEAMGFLKRMLGARNGEETNADYAQEKGSESDDEACETCGHAECECDHEEEKVDEMHNETASSGDAHMSPIPEEEMEEGNLFTGNLAKARAAGKKEADLDGDGDMEKVREESLDQPATMEEKRCDECGGVMEADHQCEGSHDKLDEWANSPAGKSADEQFLADISYMTKSLSGGLNGMKQEQTTLPSTKVKTEAEANMADVLRKLQNLN